MLKQRVITALVLLAVLLPALLHPNTAGFNAIVVLMVAAGAWEWGRLNGVGAVATWAGVLLLAGLGALGWAQGWLLGQYPLLWLVAGSAWVLGAGFLVRSGVPVWARLPLALRWPLGLLALAVAGLAMVQARVLGVNFLLSVLLLVWVADVFAYFTGRAFGQRLVKVKLAPSISPGKSWEGALGGAVGVLVMALVWVQCDAGNQPASLSLYSHLAQAGTGFLVLSALFLTAMSVLGDLVESLIKRSAGVKDSSQLLPGHGGVLDRIDALLPTLPLAMMLVSYAA
ncbi:MAG: phosphatidate cytidylyltransferase [Comamonas sp.]|nr:phosphatidate cytidylyltransferase [Comamonas sp.]